MRNPRRMLHLRLAHMCGQLDADALVDTLSESQLLEWWAYGCLNNWFINPDSMQKGGMNAEKSLEYFKGLNDGGNNNP